MKNTVGQDQNYSRRRGSTISALCSAGFIGSRLQSGFPTMSLFWRTNVNTVWRRRTCLMNYDLQQTLKSDNDCVPPRQYLWPFDALGCLPSATERFLSRPPVCGTVFRHMSPLLHPSPFFVLVLNPICFLFLILISDSLHFSLVQCLCSDFVISDTIIVITLDMIRLELKTTTMTKNTELETKAIELETKTKAIGIETNKTTTKIF